jgi:hypothetical protein
MHVVRLSLPEGCITSVMAYPEGWVIRVLDEDGGDAGRGSHLVPADSVLFVNGEQRELPPLPRASGRPGGDEDDEDDGRVLTHADLRRTR